MLYRYGEKKCLNGKWDILPVYDNQADPKHVPAEGFISDVYCVPSFMNKPKDGTRKPGDRYYGHYEGDLTDPTLDRLFDAFQYPAQWSELKTAYIRRSLTVEKQEGRRYFLVAEAVGPRTTLFVNGEPLSCIEDSTLPFEVDITEAARDGENEIVYLLEDYDYLPGGRKKTMWPSGNGIPGYMRGLWQDIYLVEKPDVMVEDVTIVTSYRQHSLKLTIVIKNKSTEAYRGVLNAQVREYKTDALALPSIPVEIAVAAGEEVTVTKEVPWENPQLWDTEHPFLYMLYMELPGKEVARERFGFREVWIDGMNLMLNGHPLHLFADWCHKITPFHYTQGWIRKWFGMLRDHNMNYSRLHTHPHAPLHMDLADEEGIFICGETGIHGSGAEQATDSPVYWEHAREHVRRFVRRDKNHPSVILWSVENEMRWNQDKTDLAKKELPKLRAWFHQLDPTRPAYHEGDSSWWNEKDQPILSRHYGKDCSGIGWWDKKQPLHSGECCLYHYAGPNNTAHLGGDSVWGSLENVTRSAAWDTCMVMEDARANGVCALGLWNISGLMNLRTHEEKHLTYEDETAPGVKPRVVRAGASEFAFGEEGKGYTPQAGDEYNVRAFRPFAVIDLSRRTSFYGDGPIVKTLHVVNDTPREQEGVLRLSMICQGRTVHSVQQPFCLKRGQIEEFNFDMSYPYPEGVYTCRREAIAGNEILDGQEERIFLSNRKKITLSEPVYLLDDGHSVSLLEESGLAYRKITELSQAPKGSLLIIGKHYIREESDINRQILSFARDGGRVILLEQQVSAFPAITLEDFPVQSAWRRGYGHPVCQQTDENTLRFWGDDAMSQLSGNTTVADRLYVKDDGTYMEVLFDAGDGGFGDGDIHQTPLFWAKEGKGLVMACQFHVSSKYQTVPAAMALFQTIVSWASSYVPEADRSGHFLLEERTDCRSAVCQALAQAKQGDTVVLSPVTEDCARWIREETGLPVTYLQEEEGTWNGVRAGEFPELSGVSNEDLCGIERYWYGKETADNYPIARGVLALNGALTPLAVTCPKSAMVPLYLNDGCSEMLRTYTSARYCYYNDAPEYGLICRFPYGSGAVYLSTLEQLEGKKGKAAPRLLRPLRRLCANLGAKNGFPSALEGEHTGAGSGSSEGYPKMIYTWDGNMDQDTFALLLSCNAYQAERMNPTQALAACSGYRTLYSEGGIWPAEQCLMSGSSTLLYYTAFSPLLRKDLGSENNVPDPAAQTFLDLTGEGEVELWINAQYCGSMTLEGKGTFSDLELERMYNHILLRWTPKEASGSLGMQWRNIQRVPERSFRFVYKKD